MVRSMSEQISARWWMPRALVAGRFCFGLRYACLSASRLAAWSTLVVAIAPPELDFEEQPPDPVGELTVADGRAARVPLIGGKHPVVGIEIEDDGTGGDARLFVRQLGILKLQLPAAALLATNADAPRRIESLRMFRVNRILQHDEHDRDQGSCGVVTQRLAL